MFDPGEHLMMDWIWAAVIIGVGILVTMIVTGIIKKAMEKSGAEALFVSFVLVVIRVICIATVVLAGLHKIGVNTSGFVTILGIGSEAVALAVKDTLANIAGGIMIIVTRQFRKDDYIEVGSYGGYVQNTDLFVTTLKTYSNEVISIPNSLLSSSVVVNHDANNTRRQAVTLKVGIGEDIEKVREVLLNVAEASPYALSSPAPLVEVTEVSDGAVSVDFVFWCRSNEYWDAKYFMHETAGTALKEADIDLR